MKTKLVSRRLFACAWMAAIVLAAAACAPVQAATVYAWGRNTNGAVGDGTTTDRWSPTLVSGLGNNVKAIAAGGGTSMVLLSDGTVKAWGYNGEGEVGDGTKVNRLVPVSVSGLSNVAAIAGGGDQMVALMNDGTVRNWGYNFYGQLGNGTTTDSSTPVTVSGLSGVTSIISGGVFSMAQLANGTVKGWGSNAYGQLGDGTTTDRHTPITITSYANATSLATGFSSSFAILAGGVGSLVKAAGNNSHGLLGDGTTTNHSTPIGIPALSNVTQIASTNDHSLALLANGTVEAWGSNFFGGLGDGTTTDHLTPTLVPGLTNVVKIAVEPSSSFALTADGHVWAWGANFFGALGVGDSTNRLSPTQVIAPAGYRFTDISGGDAMLALVAPVPEPSTWLLAALGALGVAAVAKRRSKKQ
jgi:alpha-tubulin suppressor-like RCC1 family protein